MRRRLKPFLRLEGAQAAASDPLVHAALSASAGTGKTHVLTSRVMRLLLRGTPPSAILCLTFTKAGAAEMANRIGARLAHWVRLPDEALKKELFALGEDNSPPMVERARRLFARVLEAPGGGLRIQTIHSFAQTLLAAFPAEAGIAPGFRPIEGRAQAELARRTLATLLADAEASDQRQMIYDVSEISRRLGESGAETYLLDCAQASEAMDRLGEADSIEPLLLGLIGLDAEYPEQALAERFSDESIDRRLFERLISANQAWGKEKAKVIVANLIAYLAATPDKRMAMIGEIARNIVKADGEVC
ncbi:MAG: UvrD-helicase domain-containing protein, partial [Sphingomicrobium sp.]